MAHATGRNMLNALKRGGRMVLRLTLTIAVIAGAVLVVQAGTSELTRRAEAVPTPDAAPVIPVSASPLTQSDGYTVQRAFIGQVEPQKTVSVSFELAGQLSEISVDEGDRVRAGQVLARQDLSLLESERTRLRASRAAAEAQLRFAEQTVERRGELNERGFASQAGLDEALARQDELLARLAEIDASLENVAIRVAKSTLTAPFEGRVTERLVDGGETLGPGQRVLSLVALRQPQARIGVPLDLTEADLKEAQIDLDGTLLKARLVALRPDIDPVTRTRTAIFEIGKTDDPMATPAFGQTARLIVSEQIATPGIWVPITSLKEGVRGQWTLLTVDPQQVVRAAVVEVLHAETARVFVRGAFAPGTMLIDAGPQRITVGQLVTVTNAI